jgi:acyl carrier protein
MDKLLQLMHSLRPVANLTEASDFLDLGFDSLTIMRLVAKCRMTFKVSLTLIEAIDSSNARSLAGLLASRIADRP